MSIGNFYRGDTKVYSLVFTENGSPKNVENMLITMTLKSDIALVDGGAEMQVKYTLPAGSPADAGLGTLTLTSVETAAVAAGQYYYDLQLVDSSGSPVVVTTLVSGTIDVLEDVTKDTS